MGPQMYIVYFLFTSWLLPTIHLEADLQRCRIRHNPDLDNKTTSSWLFRETTLRPSASRLDCARLCVNHDSCVTYMIKMSTRTCRLYGARITKYNALVTSAGYLSYDTCRANVSFGTICSQDSDCLLANTVCLGQTCQCDAGWSYSPNDLACVRECVRHGPEFTAFKHSFIAGNNMAVYKAAHYLAIAECAAACGATKAFICRSLELDFDDVGCKLQTVTPYHVPLCVQYGTMFTRTANSYISGYNEVTYTTAPYLTPQGCGSACVSATSFTCISFELDYSTNRCNIQKVTSFQVSVTDFLQNLIYNSDYYQRHCNYVTV